MTALTELHAQYELFGEDAKVPADDDSMVLIRQKPHLRKKLQLLLATAADADAHPSTRAGMRTRSAHGQQEQGDSTHSLSKRGLLADSWGLDLLINPRKAPGELEQDFSDDSTCPPSDSESLAESCADLPPTPSAEAPSEPELPGPRLIPRARSRRSAKVLEPGTKVQIRTAFPGARAQRGQGCMAKWKAATIKVVDAARAACKVQTVDGEIRWVRTEDARLPHRVRFADA